MKIPSLQENDKGKAKSKIPMNCNRKPTHLTRHDKTPVAMVTSDTLLKFQTETLKGITMLPFGSSGS